MRRWTWRWNLKWLWWRRKIWHNLFIGNCLYGMDHCYAQFLESECNFRPARVCHSLCAVASYYSHLKQRTKALFQLSCLWATHLTAYTHKHTHKQTKDWQYAHITNSTAHILSPPNCSYTKRGLVLIYICFHARVKVNLTRVKNICCDQAARIHGALRQSYESFRLSTLLLFMYCQTYSVV